MFYRAIFILPILMPGIVIGAIWKLMYNFDFGLDQPGARPRRHRAARLAGRHATRRSLSVIVVDIWHWTPFCFLLLLAGLESLPQDVFEAAQDRRRVGLAGARYVTLPLMMPTILVTFAFRLVLAFKVFDEVYLLTGGGPGTATEVLELHALPALLHRGPRGLRRRRCRWP